MLRTQSSRIPAILLAVVCVAGTGRAQLLIDRGGPGVVLRLYDVQQPMRHIPDLAPGQLPNVAKLIPAIDLDGARGDFAPLKDQFLTEITGFLNTTEAGKYTFRLLSDDGARLWIDDKLVIDHDGLHGPVPKEGTLELSAASHELRILHFDAAGGERLALLWKLPGAPERSDFVVIPPSVFTHDADASFATAPGKKRIIPPLRRGRPGDGTPVSGMHPSFVDDHFRKMRYTRRPDTRVNLVGIPAEKPPPLVWLPPNDQGYALAPATKCEHEPYRDQILVGNGRSGEAHRVFVDPVGGQYQGCVFRFSSGHPLGLDVMMWGANQMLLIGQWVERDEPLPPDASGPNIDLDRLQAFRLSGHTPFEMRTMRAMTNGFEIEFTKPLDPRIGWDPESYYIEQWPFMLSEPGAQATGHPPTRDGVRYPVKSASVSPDRKRVFLEIDDLRQSHVVYIRLLPPCISEDGEFPWSTEAWYTLNAIPKDRHGRVLSPPMKEPQNMLTEEEHQAGWKLLFDGKTTAGWRGYKKDDFPHEGWQVIDGCLVRAGSGGDICTVEEFDNFELKLEWRICAGGNSGIFFRVDEDLGWPWESGPEMQVLDNAEHADGRNPKTSAGSNYALHAPIRDVTQPVGLFNQVRIVADGNHIEYWLNGVKVVEYEIASKRWEELVAGSKFKKMPHHGRVAKGHIVLQDHGDKVWYRNLKIRPLERE